MAQQIISKRVLIVDDNRDAADILAEFLQLCGHETQSAYDGASAIDAAALFAPDVVLLDIGMPGLNGFEVAAALRSAARYDHTKVVALTAWGDAATRERARNVGFDAHLVKPASFESILGLVTGPERQH